jgi:DNA-binding NarL/FixJ family response regulator
MPGDDFQMAWDRGRAMSIDETVEFAIQPIISPEAETTPLSALTPRETEVLALIARRMSNREIAAELFISTRTVERHIENLYRKLDIHSRIEAIDLGRRYLIL